jgi:hypothetical protein
MTTPTEPDKDLARIRRGRNIALALVLGFFVVLVYFLTYVKMAA